MNTRKVWQSVLVLFLVWSLPLAAEGRIALLVGINDYDDSSIVKLKTPRNDALDLGALLGGPEAGWDKVFIMTDDKEYRSVDFPSRNKINQRVALIADLVKPDDVVMLFFSGHGITDQDGAAWFLPVDTVFTDWKNTAIRIPSLVETLQAKGVKKVVLAVDACRESVSSTKGISLQGVGASAESKSLGTPALALYATKSGWYSYEDPAGRNGVFTKLFLEGLSGQARKEPGKAGPVTFQDLAGWLPGASSRYSLDLGLKQQAVVLGAAGNLGYASKKSGALAVAAKPAGAQIEPSNLSPAQKMKQGLEFLKKAQELAKQRKVDSSIQALQSAIVLYPDLQEDPWSLPGNLTDDLSLPIQEMIWGEHIDLQEALVLLTVLTDTFPENPKFSSLLGHVFTGLSMERKAVETFKRVASMPPDHLDNAYYLWDATKMMASMESDQKKADLLWQQALAIKKSDQDNSDLLADYAATLLDWKKPNEAREYAQRALVLSPDNGRVYLVLARIEQFGGVASKAKEYAGKGKKIAQTKQDFWLLRQFEEAGF